MNIQDFSLQPFPQPDALPFLKITGTIARRSNRLAIGYVLCGHPAELVVPTRADIPVRKNALWEETCFEFFIALKNSPQYWEFNLSPAGHWNVYRFADYRQGMQEETAFGSLPFSVRSQSDSLMLSLELDLDGIVKADQPLEVAVSSIVKKREGKLTYWALTHHGPQPDFHRRESFIVQLQGNSPQPLKRNNP